ncbi:MAG: hypothetical protein KDB07_10415, partial [Planctomycetes bacterium]|nr:hypothetical protein [Planctomycetota bacterium]
GGNDTYRGEIASASPNLPLALLYDLAGDDDYAQEEGKIGFAAATGGLAMLIDEAGNDRYRAGDFAMGAACFGAALLEDRSGEDDYRCGQFGQGAGYVGAGILCDIGKPDRDNEDTSEKRSNDRYHCDRYGQGFGYVAGYGALRDTGGNDSYNAGGRYRHTPLLPDAFQSLSQGMGFGSRGQNFGGGIGVLDDLGSGNDTYNAEVYGQGSSYWYALGVLRDGGGNDRFTLTQYGQGAGIHLSAGILIDQGGNDVYTNFNGVGTGGAHDYAVGFLIDQAGDDAYYSNGLGQGLNNSFALCYVAAGDDAYSSRADIGIGYAQNMSIAMLIDGGGKDRYTIPMQDGLWKFRGDAGIVIDHLGPKDEALAKAPWQIHSLIEKPAPESEEGAPSTETKPAPAPEPMIAGSGRLGLEDAVLESKWQRACEWEVGTKENIDGIRLARRQLVEEGNLEFLLSKLGESYGLNLRALWGTIPHYRAEALPHLLKELQSADSYWRFRNSFDLITRIYGRQVADKDEAAVQAHLKNVMPEVVKALNVIDESRRFTMLEFLNRYNAGLGEGEQPRVEITPHMKPYLWSERDRTRLAAIRLAQALPPSEELIANLAVISLTDSYHAARLVASRTKPKAAIDALALGKRIGALLEEQGLSEVYQQRLESVGMPIPALADSSSLEDWLISREESSAGKLQENLLPALRLVRAGVRVSVDSDRRESFWRKGFDLRARLIRALREEQISPLQAACLMEMLSALERDE